MAFSILFLSAGMLFATTPIPSATSVDIAMNRCCKESSSNGEKDCKAPCKKEEECGGCPKKSCDEPETDSCDQSRKARKSAAQKVVESE